eukprot:6968106-Prymnesium_polylepis.1
MAGIWAASARVDLSRVSALWGLAAARRGVCGGSARARGAGGGGACAFGQRDVHGVWSRARSGAHRLLRGELLVDEVRALELRADLERVDEARDRVLGLEPENLLGPNVLVALVDDVVADLPNEDDERDSHVVVPARAGSVRVTGHERGTKGVRAVWGVR